MKKIILFLLVIISYSVFGQKQSIQRSGSGSTQVLSLFRTNNIGDIMPSLYVPSSNLFKVAADGSVLSGAMPDFIGTISHPFLGVGSASNVSTEIVAASSTDGSSGSAVGYFQTTLTPHQVYVDTYAQTANGASYVELDYLLDPTTPANSYWELVKGPGGIQHGAVQFYPFNPDYSVNFAFTCSTRTGGDVFHINNDVLNLLTVDYQGLTSTTALALDNGSTGLPLLNAKSAGVTSFDIASDGNIDVLNSVSYVWPSINASGSLQNNGSGVLVWTDSTIINNSYITNLTVETQTVNNLTVNTNVTVNNNITVKGNGSITVLNVGSAILTNTTSRIMTTSWTASSAGTNYVVDLTLPVLQWNMTTNLNILHATNGTANFTASQQKEVQVKVINNSGTNFPVSFPAAWKRYGSVAASSFVLTNGDWCVMAIQFAGVTTSQTNIDVAVAYKNY